MIAARTPDLPRASLLAGGLGAAVALRVAVAGNDGLQSPSAGLIFGAALVALAYASGWRPKKLRARAVALGLLGGAVLVALPAWLRVTGGVPPISFPAASFPVWALIVVAVAAAEEVFLRGALFAAVQPRTGTIGAVAMTSCAFAFMHVPLYGWGALPLDLGAGIWLGTLRAVSGGVTAPAAAHALADVATWWLL